MGRRRGTYAIRGARPTTKTASALAREARRIQTSEPAHLPGPRLAVGAGDPQRGELAGQVLASFPRSFIASLSRCIDRGIAAVPIDLLHRAGSRRGGVGLIRLDPTSLTATAPVRGTQPLPYQVTIRLEVDEPATTACTCPYSAGSSECKHGAAALLDFRELVREALLHAPPEILGRVGPASDSSRAGVQRLSADPPAGSAPPVDPAEAKRARWARLLGALERAELATERRFATDRLEWRVGIDPAGGVSIAAYLVEADGGEPYLLGPDEIADRADMDEHHAEPELTAMGRAVEERRDRWGYHWLFRPARALPELIGCPRVVEERPPHRPIEVVGVLASFRLEPSAAGEATLGFHLERPTPGGAERVRADRTIAFDDLVVATAANPGGPAAHIYVARMHAELQPLVDAALDGATELPIEGAAELANRLEALSALADTPAERFQVVVEPELAGPSIAGIPEPVLRIERLADERFRAELCVRPGPGLAPVAPGVGGAGGRGELAALDGRLVRVTRDLPAERQLAARIAVELAPHVPPTPLVAVGIDDPLVQEGRDDILIAESPEDAAILADLAATEPAPLAWSLDSLGPALDLIERARALEAAGRLVVEAARDALPRLAGSLEPKSLKVRLTGARDWLGVEGEAEVDGGRVELAALLQAIAGGARFVRLADGRYAAIEAALRDQLRPLEEAAAEPRGAGGGIEVGRTATAVMDEVLAGIEVVEVHPAWRLAQEGFARARAVSTALPEGLRAELRPYQQDGFAWLKRLATWGVGCVLADDMGLGKTVQALALCLDRAALGPQLVVAPVSVAAGWEREAARFAPGLETRIYRHEGRRLDALGPGILVIATYELARADAGRLAAVDWASLFFDEAQKVKNAGTKTAKALATIPARFRAALTGTPIENHLGELWSLYRLVEPGLFGGWESFKRRFADPIERRKDAVRQRALAAVVRPYLLRRTKQEVLADLPPRTEVLVEVELTPAERACYERERLGALAALSAPRGGKRPGDPRFQVLAALVRLRELCCHPLLVDATWQRSSAKLDRLVELLVELRAEGHRALVFSQFTRLLALVEGALARERISYLYLDGKTSPRRRGEVVDQFQRGEADAFLISLKAGGTGLNLTGADYVIHLDPWWNPAVEDQATDRAHRIGQVRPVTALKLVAKGTIEERMLALHAEKRALVASVLAGGEGAGRLSTDELIALIRGAGEDVDVPLEMDAASGRQRPEPPTPPRPRTRPRPPVAPRLAAPRTGVSPAAPPPPPPAAAPTPPAAPPPPASRERDVRDLLADPARLGAWIRERRLAEGWTQTDLAARAGVSVATVSYYECGYGKGPPPWLSLLGGLSLPGG